MKRANPIPIENIFEEGGETVREKIFYNIDESEYTFTTANFTFFFSSVYYMNKFMDRFEGNRKDLSYKLSSRFNIEVECDDYWDIILYYSIEKRGFRVEDNRGEAVYKCLKEVKLSGEIKTLENSKELLRITTQK